MTWQPTYCESCEQRMDLCRCKKEEPLEIHLDGS